MLRFEGGRGGTTFSYLRLSLSLKWFSFNFSILNRFPNLFCFSVLSKRETGFKLKETQGAEAAPEILRQGKEGEQTLHLSSEEEFKC